MNAPDNELLAAAKGGDKAAAEELITGNMGLIWSVARRFFGKGVDPDDLFQLGCIGFIKAVNGFDSGFGTQFSTYAVPKIAGEIRRFLRDDGTVKVSRGLKENAAKVHAAKARLEQKLSRSPTVSEVAEETGLAPEEIAECEGATGTAESLQRSAGEDGFTLEHILGDRDAEERMVERVALKEAISALPEKERAVIFLRYYRGMTQDKTARVLSVSQVQVSRLERRAVEKMRGMLI